ncbi:MAG: sugar dehydrogenase, partial [Myxococcaceae bacterium]|nr:sugar dehydrogenase [Myxococcaceae bacterium]
MLRGRRLGGWLLSLLMVASASCAQSDRAEPPSGIELQLATGFTSEVVFSGLTQPTSLRFASDGTIFVAQKTGQIYAYDNAMDKTPSLVADLSSDVNAFWDKGLLDIEVDPNWPAAPYVYALYTYDKIPGTSSFYNDVCPDASGSCPSLAHLEKLTISLPAKTVSNRKLLVENWGGQFQSHNVGTLRFGPDGMLYVGCGEGGNFNAVDYGNFGNPLGDPPTAGASLTAPTSMGGALRAQIIDPPVATPAFPKWFSGKIVRIDPNGAPMLDPRTVGVSPVVGYGMRNPFRFTFRPGTHELWIGDVGW